MKIDECFFDQSASAHFCHSSDKVSALESNGYILKKINRAFSCALLFPLQKLNQRLIQLQQKQIMSTSTWCRGGNGNSANAAIWAIGEGTGGFHDSFRAAAKGLFHDFFTRIGSEDKK